MAVATQSPFGNLYLLLSFWWEREIEEGDGSKEGI